MSPRRTSNGLPVTAYPVLGVLAANDEQLTDRRWDSAGSGQTGATVEGPDPPPGDREPDFGATTA